MARVFVYGTLRAGEPAHALLAGARALGPARTEAEWELLDLGAYPALVPGRSVVVGELYEVGGEALARLDELEDAPRLFRRAEVRLAGGARAEAYVLAAAPPPGARPIPGGDWRARGAPPGGEASSW